MYIFILMCDILKGAFPLKQNNFLRLCFRGKVQSALELSGRGWPGSIFCVSSGVAEDVDHILFNCPMARFLSCVIRDRMGKYLSPKSRDEFVEIFLSQGGNKSNKLVWYWFAVVVWDFWLTRNERIFQHKVLANPLLPLYRALSLMLQWKPQVKTKMLQGIEEIIKKV
jgi:hypothetical protein